MTEFIIGKQYRLKKDLKDYDHFLMYAGGFDTDTHFKALETLTQDGLIDKESYIQLPKGLIVTLMTYDRPRTEFSYKGLPNFYTDHASMEDDKKWGYHIEDILEEI